MNDATASGEPGWVSEVLAFWFDELAPDDWWRKSEDVDSRIRTRFLALHEQLVSTGGGNPTGPRMTLATVIVLDQFSRNIFRGTPLAFAADPIARRIARDAIERGIDSSMTQSQRLFLYLPFEHSEDRADQVTSVKLISALGDEAWTNFAVAHQSVIERFGRFPHRNSILGRESTQQEITALAGPGMSF